MSANPNINEENIKDAQNQGAENEVQNEGVKDTEGVNETLKNEDNSKDTDTNKVEENQNDELEINFEEQFIKVSAEKEELEDRFKRLAAEYDNYRKRTLKEKEMIYSDAISDFAIALLPVIDDFERAMECECKDKAFKDGMEMVFKKFKEFLAKQGIEEIEAKGEFDPEFHSAIMHVEDPNLPANYISMVFQKGYKYKDKVIRHTLVQVAN